MFDNILNESLSASYIRLLKFDKYFKDVLLK